MRSIQTLLAACILFTAISCKKETIKSSRTQSESSVSEEDLAGNCVKPWYGIYADGIIPNDTISQNKFIKNGIAQLPPNNLFTWYHTGIYYNIPSCHFLVGDSITFEASVQNPSNGIGAVSDYDVVFQLWGSKNYASVYFVGNTNSQSYDNITIGNSVVWNMPELVHYFGNYETFKVVIKNKTVSIYINGVFVKSMPYDASNKIGKIKTIGYGFKGTGAIDWVKLYSSNSNQQIMQEDFNVNGKSNVVWF
jgi:hypothetical protein